MDRKLNLGAVWRVRMKIAFQQGWGGAWGVGKRGGVGVWGRRFWSIYSGEARASQLLSVGSKTKIEKN